MTAEKLKEALELANEVRLEQPSADYSYYVASTLSQALIELSKEIESAPLVYSHRCGNKQDDIWDAWSNEEPWDCDTHKARLVRIEEIKP